MAVAMNAGALRGAHAVEAGGAATESMGGVAVIVLSILSLLGVVPRILTPIAGIVFGIAFMVEGAAIAARQATLIQQTERTDVTGAPELEVGGGVTIELTVGAAAIVLGVLALIGVVPGDPDVGPDHDRRRGPDPVGGLGAAPERAAASISPTPTSRRSGRRWPTSPPRARRACSSWPAWRSRSSESSA